MTCNKLTCWFRLIVLMVLFPLNSFAADAVPAASGSNGGVFLGWLIFFGLLTILIAGVANKVVNSVVRVVTPLPYSLLESVVNSERE